MNTEPIIVNTAKSARAYISFYFNGVRQRIYSGRALGLKIFPNRIKTPKERIRSLQTLRAELLKALAADKYPFQLAISSEQDLQHILRALNQLTMESKQSNALNQLRLTKLEQIHDLLADYLISHDDTPE